MDAKTLAHVDKDRTQLFQGQAPFQITEATGEQIRKWNDSGKVMTDREKFRQVLVKKTVRIASLDEQKKVRELSDEVKTALKEKGYETIGEVADYFRSKDWDIDAVKYELGLISELPKESVTSEPILGL